MRASRVSYFFTSIAVLLAVVGCGDDGPIETATMQEPMTTGADTGTATSGLTVETTTLTPTTTNLTTTTGEETGGSCPGGIVECGVPQYPIDGAPFTVSVSEAHMLSAEQVCATLKPSMPVLSVRVVHPDPLPAAPLPLAIIANGQGQVNAEYEHIMNPLAELGFIVAAVQTESETESRAAAVACTLRWLRKTWVSDHCAVPNCDFVMIGHSRGGEATWAVANALESIPWFDIHLSGIDVALKALVGIAPRFDVDFVGAMAPDHAVPYLAIMGATDEDVTGEGIMAYDAMVKEASRTASDPGKLLLWPYDVPHNAFGGKSVFANSDLPVVPALTTAEYMAKGRTIASLFIPAFVEFFVMGNDGRYPLLTGETVPGALMPDGMDMGVLPDWWEYLEPAFSELGGNVVIPRNFSHDQRENPGIRSFIDDFESGPPKFQTTLAPEQIAIGSQVALAAGTGAGGPHLGQVMRVRWGDTASGGTITWELDGGQARDLGDFSLLSLRVGQELVLEGDALQDCALLPMDPRTAALELSVQLVDSEDNVAEVALGPIVQQESRLVQDLGFDFCGSSQFMPTLRIPLDEFCATPGFDVTSVVSLTLEFPELMHQAGVYMDTLEFTKHPLDDEHLCM